MAMDTLKAARRLEASGLSKQHAEAITELIRELGRADLVTKDYLDTRLLQLAVGLGGFFIAVAGLFKLFG